MVCQPVVLDWARLGWIGLVGELVGWWVSGLVGWLTGFLADLVFGVLVDWFLVVGFFVCFFPVINTQLAAISLPEINVFKMSVSLNVVLFSRRQAAYFAVKLHTGVEMTIKVGGPRWGSNLCMGVFDSVVQG